MLYYDFWCFDLDLAGCPTLKKISWTLTFESEWLLIVVIYTWLPPARYVVHLTTLVIMLHSFLIGFCVILSLIKTLGVTFGNYCRVYSFTIYIKKYDVSFVLYSTQVSCIICFRRMWLLLDIEWFVLFLWRFFGKVFYVLFDDVYEL